MSFEWVERLSSEGDMSGQASLNEREKDEERLESLILAVPSGLFIGIFNLKRKYVAYLNCPFLYF